MRLALPRGIFQPLVPLFVPENSHSNELLRHHDGLLDQGTAVFPHVLKDALCCILPALVLALGGYSEGVHQGLWEESTNITAIIKIFTLAEIH